MKTIVLAAVTAAALLAVSLSSPINAQSTPDQGKDYTKVYAYKKQLPSPSPQVAAPQQQQVATPAYHPNPIPYGSRRWWEEAERTFGSAGSGD